MLEAEIHGKLPTIENMEDILTSNVFSLLNYVNNKKLIFDILSKAKTIEDKSFFDLHKFDINEYNPEILFWQNLGKYGEPDIIIRFRSESNTDLFLVIEIKFFSSKSGEGDNDQLMRYFKGVKELSVLHDSELLGVIYLTKYSSNNEIMDTLDCLKKDSEDNFSDKIFKLRWHEISSVIERYALKVRGNSIIDDLYRYLIFKNLVSFKKFSFLNENFELKFESIYQTDKKLNDFDGFSFVRTGFILESNGVIIYGE